MHSSSVARVFILGVVGVLLALTVLPAVVTAFFDTLTRIAAMYPGPTLVVLLGLLVFCFYSAARR